jgi:hypothetical protein
VWAARLLVLYRLLAGVAVACIPLRKQLVIMCSYFGTAVRATAMSRASPTPRLCCQS